jgi:hypothetical protein
MRGGQLIHEDSEPGSAQLKGTSYRADKFKASLELTFLESEGMFELQLGADNDNCVWFALGSAGYEASVMLNGKPNKTHGRWTMRTGEKSIVECSIDNDTLLVTVDTVKLKPLKHRQLSQLNGPIIVRAQGLRLALDNIAMRQTE